MEIFANWIFWVSLAAVIFLFALIGYLSDSRRKKKESETSYVKPEVTPLEVNTAEDVADNSNVTTPVESGATLNLDNGTWNSDAEANEVQTTSMDSFDNPFVPNTEENLELGEQPASDLFSGFSSQEGQEAISDGELSPVDVTTDLGDSNVLANDNTSDELNVFDQSMVVSDETLAEQPGEVVSDEALAEQPGEVVTDEALAEQPGEVVSDETLAEQPAEVVTDEALVEQPTEVTENIEPIQDTVSTEVNDNSISEEATSTDDTSSDTEIWKF